MNCLVLLAGVAAVLAACTRAGPPSDQRRARSDVLRVERTEETETWRAATVFQIRGREVLVDEEVVLDARGLLVRAFVRTADGKSPLSETWYERGKRTISVEHGREIERFTAEDDAPWAYAPVVAPDGITTIPTPLGAWVTYRAASHGAAVRVIDPAHHKSVLIPRDQLVAVGEGEGSGVVVIGDDGADVDREFVQTIRFSAAQVTLTRSPAAKAAGGPFLFR